MRWFNIRQRTAEVVLPASVISYCELDRKYLDYRNYSEHPIETPRPYYNHNSLSLQSKCAIMFLLAHHIKRQIPP